jgi:hypothetical protein
MLDGGARGQGGVRRRGEPILGLRVGFGKIPCPQRCSRGRDARQRPAGEAAEEGGRPVGEVAGVCAVLGEALVGSGDGRSDPSTWMASTTVGVDGGR